jgi:SAM-dependent methyltransferase
MSRKPHKVRDEQNQVENVEKHFLVSRNRHIANWQHDADNFAAHGHYEWMASFLKGRHLILDVGCGAGNGVAALCKNGATVVSIEENPTFIALAEKNLERADVAVKKVLREKIVLQCGVPHISYDNLNCTLPEAGALLVNGDFGVGNDIGLDKWLERMKFDAITCWLMGTHDVRRQKFGDITKYRLGIQSYIYQLGNKLLRSDGVLHFVDRGKYPDDPEFWKGVLAADHKPGASGTSLVVDRDSVQIRAYTPPQKGGVLMKCGGSAGNAVAGELALFSIMARKP